MGYIYQIKNTINGKIYVGKTDRDPLIRWEEHKRHLNLDTLLAKASRKYGIDNFSFEIIEEVDNTDEREKYWINKLNTCILNENSNGYNLTYGGDGQLIIDREKVILLFNQGYTCSQISNELNCNSITASRILKELNITQQQILENSSNYFKQRERDPVLQYTKDGVFIKEWNSATEIERETGYSRSNIKSCCNNKIKSAYGYIWKRKYKTGPQRGK